MTHRIKPWRGAVTGQIYYDIQESGLLFWHKIITCFDRDEAEKMLDDLRRWNVDCKAAQPGEDVTVYGAASLYESSLNPSSNQSDPTP